VDESDFSSANIPLNYYFIILMQSDSLDTGDTVEKESLAPLQTDLNILENSNKLSFHLNDLTKWEFIFLDRTKDDQQKQVHLLFQYIIIIIPLHINDVTFQ
jgi:hypothetical protein